MLSVALRRWSAWAPGIESAEAWRAWAAAPAAIAAEGSPDARFLPAMLRRRCSPLSRAMLSVAFEACPETERALVRTVFASRHGENRESFPLFAGIAAREPLSPTRFTMTVHNVQAGLYSIAAGNRQASSSLAAEADTFPAAFLEALAHLEREPGRSVLLVTGDVPIAPLFEPLIVEPPVSYALALLLARDGEGTELGFEPAGERRTPGPTPRLAWPQALELVRWLHGDEPDLVLGERRSWRFLRV